MAPSATCTLPRSVNGVSRQPWREWPSNMDVQLSAAVACPMQSARSKVAGRPLPAGIVTLVVIAVRAAAHALDPLRIGPVPIDGAAQPGLEVHPRLPAGLAHQLRARKRISAVVARPVLHILDQTLRLPRQR